MPRPSLLVATVLLALTLPVSGCGASTERVDTADGADGAAADRSTTSTTVGETGNGSDSESDGDRTTTTAGTTTTGTGAETDPGQEQPAADVTIVGSLSQGELMVEDRRYDVPIGSSVLITFESDEVEHIHLHGYDLLADLVPGQPAEIAFVADSPGSFEVELEDSGRFLFELLVR